MNQVANTFQHSFKKVLLIGIAVSLLGAAIIYSLEKSRLDTEFEARSEALRIAIDHQIGIYIAEVEQLASFVDANSDFEYSSFRIFTQSYVGRDLSGEQMKTANYSRYVRHEELTDYLAEIRSHPGSEDFVIYPAGERDHYLPVTYLPRGVVRGTAYDLIAPTYPYAERIQQTIDSGDTLMTEPLILFPHRISGKTDINSLVIRKAVYRGGPQQSGVEARRQNLDGLVAIVLYIPSFVELVLHNNSVSELALTLSDCGVVGSPIRDCKQFYDSQQAQSQFWYDNRSTLNNDLHFAGRTWQLTTAPSQPLWQRLNLWVVVVPSLLLMLLSVILSLFVVRLSREHATALGYAFDRADHDELTKLTSRNRILQDLRNSLMDARERGRCLAVLFIDLDHFKRINDTLGHSTGDDLLKLVADRLRNYLGANTRLGRLGGDEFLVLMDFDSMAERERIVAICEGLLRVIREPYWLEPRSFTIGCSIGIAVYPEAGTDAGSLIKSADMAMYAAKAEGRSTYRFFNESMGEQVKEHVHMESLLRGATERGEFSMVYQPKVDLTTNKVVGCEALIRWNSGELGNVSPVKFIPVAEDSGQIHDIGEWVLAEVCEQITAWRQQGLDVPRVAVNVSAVQLQRTHFVEQVKTVLDRYNLPANSLEFELTETILVENSKSCKSLLNEIKALGIELSLDDFGTGYSSLSYLKMFPFDSVKIDRSFVRDLVVDPNDAALTQAIISMGHSLGMQVVAEGVEDEAQLEFLLLQHCDYAQGYLFSKPVSSQEMSELLRASEQAQLPFQQFA